MAESWDAVISARRAGVDCIAMTAWALLGSFFWNQLVTCANGHYEPGVFDLRHGNPVPTELAFVVAQIATGQEPSHPALAHRGWWHHPNRISLPGGDVLAA
jgi:dTDP-4-dehydrorhamnose reductase